MRLFVFGSQNRLINPQGPCLEKTFAAQRAQFFQVIYIPRGTHSVLILNETSGSLEIGRDHLVDELVKGHFAGPAKHALGFCRIPEEKAISQHP